ncbi:MAG: redoxin domain-containing protein [Bacteroidales bacterium]|nr:redoxin domain-containing protein [Bacteroidales bacterium]
MKHTGLLLILIFISTASFCQKYIIEGQINNYYNKTIIISSYLGGKTKIIDSTLTDSSGNFKIIFSEKNHVGLYKLSFYNKFIDIIFNYENISLITDIADTFEKLQILSSHENILFLNYIQKQSDYRLKLELLDPLIYNYPKTDSFYINILNQFEKLQNEQAIFIDTCIKNNPETYFTKIVKIEKLPEIQNGLSEEEYKNFLKIHHFDNIDFSDTTILYNKFITQNILSYLSLYADKRYSKEEQEQAFIEAVDVVLKKVSVNLKMYEFVANYLIDGLQKFDFGVVVDYIVDNDYLSSFCKKNEVQSEVEKRIENLKKLKIGKIAPEFSFIEINGKEINLYEINSELTLLIFWSSACHHCSKSLQKLKIIYDQQSQKKLEVIAISLDTNKNAFSDAIAEGDYNWINYTDLQGWEGNIATLYSIYATPTMFLLNNEKKIIAKPITIKELEKKLKELNF